VPYGLLAVLALGLAALVVKLHNRRKHDTKYFFDVVHETAEALGDHPLRIAAVDALLIIGTSFLSWRWLAATIGLVAGFGGGVRWLDRTKKTKLIGSLGLVLGAVVTGLGWQITNGVPVQSVDLSPPLPYVDHAIPYFGETSQFIYVGVVVPDTPAGVNPHLVTHRIEELKRSQYLLTFNAKPFLYCRADITPAMAVLHLFGGTSSTPKVAQC
jgi:hypothetical protein